MQRANSVESMRLSLDFESMYETQAVVLWMVYGILTSFSFYRASHSSAGEGSDNQTEVKIR